MAKVLIWGGIIVLIAGAGAALWFTGTLEAWITQMTTTEIPQEEQKTTQQQPQPPPSELSTGSNSSDQALAEDTSALDAQIAAYGEASTELDKSMSDQPVVQEY